MNRNSGKNRRRLRERLNTRRILQDRAVKSRFDLVILDAANTFGFSSTIALLAATHCAMPVRDGGLAQH